MNLSTYPLDGRLGKIIKVDEPGDLDTMYRFVHEQQRAQIVAAQRDALFVLIVFEKKPDRPSEQCLSLPDWYPVYDRKDIHNASVWHQHWAVALHCPYQEEEVIPTAISTHQLVEEGKNATGIRPKLGEPQPRENLIRLNEAITKFTPDIIQPSGYTLIIPEGETHVKIAPREDFPGNGGIIHRHTWK